MMCSKNSGTAFIDYSSPTSGQDVFHEHARQCLERINAVQEGSFTGFRLARIHHATSQGRFRDAGLDPLIFYGLDSRLLFQ
jgi:hypothetical protein